MELWASGLSAGQRRSPANLPSGLCLEKVPAASPSLSNKNTGSPSSIKSTLEQDIITCYEKSGDIGLLYLQEAEKVQLYKFPIL